MLITIAKWTIIFFGLFLIFVSLVMLFAPQKARQILRKAGSSNLINYTEITLRMIPATALILYADLSKFPEYLSILGWFMLATSFLLYFVPRKMHHAFSLQCAHILKPFYFQLISPFSFLFGAILIYAVS